ncbi:hypothetical protein VOLCADRAFT_87230 [Volvox carteri f. nagariensis]|uniref:Uncharacterized protein n=1 Tax=Volvox carteri f. nagariensis TaxID=3068 RepID=D8TKI0_VOLCA|nr:uncharacterized protein VOLCADRAFT_87230 [Volvox carteri f. nagariensis]EFJ52249.1 hypothetical protein VOLCADRAFT_87230 [Volvox carteri f. nagariensis]|eukprot:XP_002947023.1 hypothetical protein VOLCADRAFT_87230 [Volvox carteri f. nagariensis]
MVKRLAGHQGDGVPAKRRKFPGPEAVQKVTSRLRSILESLVQNATLTEDCSVSGQLPTGCGREALLARVSLPECKGCAFHLCHRARLRADDIRQRVSPWAWRDVKNLLHSRCVHSLTAQHSKDGERVLLRGFLHVPHDDVEICSCNGTPTAAHVSRAAAAANNRSAGTTGGGRTPANPDGPNIETSGGAAALSAHGVPSGDGDGAAPVGLAAPGTCGPPERSTHVVEVLLSCGDWSLLACSSSCCGVGYDPLHSQLCPAVAAVLLAARVAGGADVLCEHDLSVLAAAARKVMPQQATEAGVAEDSANGSGTDATPGAAAGAAGQGPPGGSGTAAANGHEGFCSWPPEELGFGPPPVARTLVSLSGGALVLGPTYVDPPAPLAPSVLPGAGLPLGLQQELNSRRRTPESIRQHRIPCSRPPAPSAGEGPSTSTARPPPNLEPPPVPAPHIPALPASEAGSRVNPRYPGGYSSSAFPSATARAVFSSWYREATAIVVTTDRLVLVLVVTHGLLIPSRRLLACKLWPWGSSAASGTLEILGLGTRWLSRCGGRCCRKRERHGRYRETYRMLLPPEEEPLVANVGAAAEGVAAGDVRGQSAGGRHALARATGAKPVQLPPPSWSFGAAGGVVSLELSGSESAENFISARAPVRGPVWEARMTFLTSHATIELDPETRLHTNSSEAPDPWPHVVLSAFDEACSPVGQPAGANGPAGALCGLLRVTWLCLHVWELDAGLARRVKLVLQAICKLLLAADLPAYLRAASARLLGVWRLKLGDAAAQGRRTGYGSSSDLATSEVLTRLTTAYILARDGWSAAHVVAAMGLTPTPVHTSGPLSGPATVAPALVPGGGRLGREVGAQHGVQPSEYKPSATVPGRGNPICAGKASSTSRPELLPTWLGFKPANQAAVRRLQQQPQQAGPPSGPAGGGGVPMVVLAGTVDPYASSMSTVMPFVPYAPPPLQGVASIAIPAMQEVVERLHWLGHFGLDGPYVSLAAVSGEWSKAIKMLLRRGAKSDVERACRLAVERLSSAAAKAQQACFLLHQVLGPPQQTGKPLKHGSEAAIDTPGPTGTAAVLQAATAATDAGAGGAAGVDSLVVSAVAQLPPTFVAGCAGRMFMSAVRAALSIKIVNDATSNSVSSPNATFEMSFLRANANAQNDATSPAAALLAAIAPAVSGGGGGTRPSPYTALLRSVIALVAENQERDWRAEVESLRELGIIVSEQERTEGGGNAGGAGASGASGSNTDAEGRRIDGRHSNSGALARPGLAVDGASGGAPGDLAAAAGRGPMEYMNALTAVMRHSVMGAAMARREEHCDCDACRRERRERLALLASEMPPGTVQYTKLRYEDVCFVTDPAILAAFTKVVPLVSSRSGPGGGPRVHSLAVQVVRSVFRPMMAVLADPRERPRTPAEYVALLGTVEESMGTLCEEIMPERVQLQAILEGVTVALCALYSCHHSSGANPSALGRVVTDLLGAGQLALARQIRLHAGSADSLAHALEVAIASGEDAQQEAALELLRTAATDPPAEHRLPALMAAAVVAGRAALGLGPDDLHLGGHGVHPGEPYPDDSDEDESDEFTDYFSDDDDDDEGMDDLDAYGAFMLGFPYGGMLYADREARRDEQRRRRREQRQLLREDRQALRAMLLEAERHADAAEDRENRDAHGEHDTDSEGWEVLEGGPEGEPEAGTAVGGEGCAHADTDVDTEDLMDGVWRCEDEGGNCEELTGPAPMDMDGEGEQRTAGVSGEKGFTGSAGRMGAAGSGVEHGSGVRCSGGGAGGGNGSGGDRTGAGLASGSGGSSPGRLRFRRRRLAQTGSGPTGTGAGAGSGSEVTIGRRLMKIEGEQNLFALAQYIRGRGSSAHLVAPLMAGAVVCVEHHMRSIPSKPSMEDFANEMVTCAPLRHTSRVESRGGEGPCLKGLPASSWQAFITARGYRYATDRDEAGQLREVVVTMENNNLLVLTAWVCAAFSGPADLPGRRRVLAAMGLAASRRYGLPLAHLGLAMARAGLKEAAVAVAARALASTAVDYSNFTQARSHPHGTMPAVGQLPWYAACLMELTPVFVEVLQQVTAREQQKQSKGGGAINKGSGAGTAETGPYPQGAEAEAAAAAEAEVEGRGVGEWRLRRLEPSEARSAVANLAVTLLLLRCELPRCLLGCSEAVTAVMALLSKVATRNNIKHEQLFEGGGAGSSLYEMTMADNSLRVWVVAAMRECLLGPLRSAPREVQQAFVTAVAAMPDNELDFKMKIPLLEWARGARVPVSTIFDAASRAVASATRILENEAAEERRQLSNFRTDVAMLARSLRPVHVALVGPGASGVGLLQGPPSHALAQAANLGLQNQVDALMVVRELDLVCAAANGQGGIDTWIADKCSSPSWATLHIIGRASATISSAATTGHRSWVWHVLKWVGERLQEEMAAVTAAEAAEPQTSVNGGGKSRRSSSSGVGDGRETSPIQPGAGASQHAAGDPRVMLRQLVERTGQFRGPELLPLACTLLNVVAHEGSNSGFVDSARQLLARAVLPDAGRASSLAGNDAWRSAEYRAGLRRVLERWMAERVAAPASSPTEHQQQPMASGRPRRAAVIKSMAAGSLAVTDDLAERVAFTLVLSEGSVAALRTASLVMDLTRSAGAAPGAPSPTASPTARGSASGRASGGIGGVAAATSAFAAGADQLSPRRLELLLPVQHAMNGGGSVALELGGGPGGRSLGLQRVTLDWEDRGQRPAATMPASMGWTMEPLSLHVALRLLLGVGAIDLPVDDPKAAAIMRFLQVQAAPPAEALSTALMPLGFTNPPPGPPTGSPAGSTVTWASATCVSRSYSPRYSVTVWRLVLQLMRRDPGLMAVFRGASRDLDDVHLAMQVGTRALAPGTSSSHSLTWQRRMDAPAVVALGSLRQPHVRCAVTMLRVWVGSRWLLGTCCPPPPHPLEEELHRGGGDANIPLEEKEPAVALLVDDIIRINKLSLDLAMDCIRENATKYPPPTVQQLAQGKPQAHSQQAQQQLGQSQVFAQVSAPLSSLEAALMAGLGGQMSQLPGATLTGTTGGAAGTSAGGQGQGQGQRAAWTYQGSALLSGEEVGRLNRLEGFVAALGEHVRADPMAKKVLSVLQPRLPQLNDKLLRFLHKNRIQGGATREALAHKLQRDFNVAELDSMRAQHLPWTPTPAGTKAMKASELAEWIAEHQTEYLEQQGVAAPHRRRMGDFPHPFF